MRSAVVFLIISLTMDDVGYAKLKVNLPADSTWSGLLS
jgi:hypothetical protein